MISTRDLVSTVLPANVWASTVIVLGGVGVMSGGRLVLQVACGEGRNLLLQCREVGLVLKQECLIIAVVMGKVGHSSSCTGVVDAGISKCCFFIVKGLHGAGEECAEVGQGVPYFRH